MSKTEKHPLQVLLENADLHGNVRAYSGRGAFGKECLGITVSNVGDLIADVMAAAADWVQDDPDGDRDVSDIADPFRVMRTDSMGRDTVVYFPGVPFVKDDEEEDESDDDEEGLEGDNRSE